MKKIVLICTVALSLNACVTAQQHAQNVDDAQGSKLTVGTVQREIKKGMSSAQVAEVLGSPNIVSTDENGHEVWIYDKISTLRVVSASSGGMVLGGAAVGGSAGLLGGFGMNSTAGAASTSQRTLTIIIKYDGQNRVKSTAYNYSSF